MRREVIDLLAANAEHARQYHGRFDDVQEGQHPTAVTICCSDSRVLQDHLWGNDEPGRLFTASNIGNRVVQRTDAGDVVSGDVLYPIAYAGTEVVLVVGHTGCGAVTAAYDDLADGRSDPPGIEHCLDVLTSAVEPGFRSLPPDLDRAAAVNRLVEYNVDRQIEFLLGSDDVPDSTTIVGVVYDFQDVYSGRRGAVHVVNVDGERAVAALREAHPAIESRFERLWEG